MAGIIRRYLCHQFILFIIIAAFPIRSFDILQRIHFKGNILKRSGYIFKQMGNPAAKPFQKRYFVQKFSFFIDDKKPGWYIIFHFQLLYFCSIIHGKGDFLCLQITVRSKFLFQCIRLPCGQVFYDMFLSFDRLPCIQNSSVLIQHGQRCSGKFHTCREIRLFHRNRGRFILKF